MIRETKNRRNSPVLTSDHWHVLRARWNGDPSGEPIYDRTIESEHEDSASAAKAGRKLVETFVTEMAGRTRETRDQVLVRRPGYRSLKTAKRTRTRG
ncbi:MAG: hypothetical protein ACKVXR_10690 [Planctomycetota bacterium]